MTWENWELFVAYHEVFRNNLLVDCGVETISLRDLYPWAYGHESTLNIKVKLKKQDLYRVNEHFLCPNMTAKESYDEIHWKENYTFVNGGKAPFADVFNNRQKACQNKFIIFLFQIKWSEIMSKLELNTVLEEHIKNLKGMIENIDILVNYQPITIIFTSQPFEFDIDELPKDCLLIAKPNFQKYFGSFFSSRASLVTDPPTRQKTEGNSNNNCLGLTTIRSI